MRAKRWLSAHRRGGGFSGSLEAGDARLLAGLDREFRTVAATAQDALVCKPGCDECCHGPFPITRLDAWRLGRGMRELRRREFSRAERLLERAHRAACSLRDGFPGNAQSGKLATDEPALDRFFERHRRLPCPALDPANGRCELYAWRPVACRTYGPPIRFGDETAPACGLCFLGASPELVARCRMEPDVAGHEQALLRRLDVPPGEEWETLIAFALS
jgi:Fe-S-cluster containining protein